MKLSSQIKPISYLKAHVVEIMRTLEELREPLIITQNGEARAIMQDIIKLRADNGNDGIIKNSGAWCPSS